MKTRGERLIEEFGIAAAAVEKAKGSTVEKVKAEYDRLFADLMKYVVDLEREVRLG